MPVQRKVPALEPVVFPIFTFPKFELIGFASTLAPETLDAGDIQSLMRIEAKPRGPSPSRIRRRQMRAEKAVRSIAGANVPPAANALQR